MSMEPVGAIDAQAPRGRNDRRFERFSCKRHVLVHCHGRFQRSTIRDVSRGGFGLDDTFGLMPGDQVLMEFVSGRKIEGKIAWSLGRRAGAALEEPLPPDDPLLRHPTILCART